jgi:hydrogenase nickel incorporation protein HypA/HybF
MHEISLVRSIFSSLEAEFSKENLNKLNAIYLRVGKLSNVEPLLMQSAFDAVKTAEEKFAEVILHIEVLPIEIFCENCRKRSAVDNYKFICQTCRQPNNNVVQGLELLINKVEFDD